ncbi:TrkH family potassium uptake protein [Aliikangiella sp. G2MR2-5]|uniref:TrkH family potassium uptake protein n=1 Tax=Aliikangiella sp. G2MR2-5 TaxID=2788943 RepID=UPI0018A9B396|nr:TrkH family potassium uptake protein [Aliikangiella sp. G2MR2-5]
MFRKRFVFFVGLVLSIFSCSFLPPIIISKATEDGQSLAFELAFIVTLAIGLFMWLPSRRLDMEIKFRESFVMVTFIWFFIGLTGAIPFVEILHLSLVDAVFETLSGLSTAGSTVLSGLDEMPKSLLFYRQELQWIGGMGIIVLVVAVLPLLNVGGMKLFKAETPGPMKDEKLSPRILHTAQYLWVIYLGLTIACSLSFYLAGMSLFDAVCHAMTAVSTGGFSTHDASIGYFDSFTIELLASVFMLLGAINFALHFSVLNKLSLEDYIHDEETKTFIILVLILVVITATTLFISGYSQTLSQSFRLAFFEVITIITSTGYGIDDFSNWPTFLPAMLIFCSFLGGCSGSTAGGIKIVRIKIWLSEIGLQLYRLVHPKAIQNLRYNGQIVSNDVLNSIRAFFTLYALTAAAYTLAMIATGLDFNSAFGAVAACLNVLGPGLGKTASSFAEVSDTGKWLMSSAMIAGRLEIFTVIVLLSPSYWRELQVA